jgi:hypothetical protein
VIARVQASASARREATIAGPGTAGFTPGASGGMRNASSSSAASSSSSELETASAVPRATSSIDRAALERTLRSHNVPFTLVRTPCVRSAHAVIDVCLVDVIVVVVALGISIADHVTTHTSRVNAAVHKVCVLRIALSSVLMCAVCRVAPMRLS